MMRGDLNEKNKVAIKFVMSKLKRLIMDDHGNYGYMEYLDNVFQDIFGVKNFTKKIQECYDDRELITIINEIGMKNLMQICNTQRTYTAFADLVLMNAAIRHIKKKLKKTKNKEKRVVKEYNYLLDTYRKAIKTLRKTFNISDKTSYKKKFKAVNALIDSRKGFSYYDDDGSISSIMYDGSSSFYDEDDDDDYDSVTEFDKYLKSMLPGSKTKKKVRNSHLSKDNYFDEDDDEDDIDDDDDCDDDESEIELKVNNISNQISTLTSTIQSLVNSNNSKVYSTPKSEERVSSYDTQFDELTKAIMFLAKNQKDSNEKQGAILECLQSMLVDDNDDDDISAVVCENDDVQTNLSIDQLIDVVNNENPANIGPVNKEPRPSTSK